MKRVLVVEDEALVAMMIEDHLVQFGYDVVGPVASVRAAMRLIDTHALDAAVLDVNLGGEHIDAVADALEARGVPILFLTGYGAAPGGRPNAALLGKPFSTRALQLAVRALVQP